MNVTVGQQIAGGKLVIAEVDTDSLVTKVIVEADQDPQNPDNPFTLTISPSQTVAAIEALFGAH